MASDSVHDMMLNRPFPHYPGLVASTTAHVIIDLQRGFLEPGAPFEVPTARSIVPAVNRISAAVREAGGVNIFVRYVVDPDETSFWRSFHELMPSAQRELAGALFTRGQPAQALWSGLEVGEKDLILDKTRLSALIPGTCDLQTVLTQRGIDTLIITGTVTNGCCESTARDAAQMGYRVFFVDDANAAWSEDDHNAAINNLAQMAFADVRTTDAILGLLIGVSMDNEPAG